MTGTSPACCLRPPGLSTKSRLRAMGRNKSASTTVPNNAAPTDRYRLCMAAEYTQQQTSWVRLKAVTSRFVVITLASLLTLAGCVRYEDGRAAFDNRDYPTAFAKWQLLAKFGDAKAQNELGWLYQNGLGTDPDAGLAVLWYRKAASQGLTVAQTNLGIMLNDGIGVPRDHREASKWFSLAARKNDPSALNNLGVLYDKGDGVPENDIKAVELLTKAAELGHPRAMSNLGLMFKLGEGVPQDAATAIRWFKAAAEKKDPEGMNNLAVMLDQGLGTEADPTKAMQLFEIAARSGEPAAAVNLAMMFLRSTRDVDRVNPTLSNRPVVKAYAWLNIAAGMGYVQARDYRTKLQNQLSPAEIAEAQRLSVTWSNVR
ncbi:MAG: sel1 repeat family protein [Gammaproteobacteria bacterium]|nr:sel1 repeat family protein [Gammaproteobacteria bacterium]